jgi:hypothetical protein
MLSEGDLVGYIDAFPISEKDYQFLLTKGERKERLITPLRPEAVDDTCSFYVASVVVAREWGGHLRSLLTRAIAFYCGSYPKKLWVRVCAIAYSEQGLKMLEKREARRVPDVKVKMYAVDRQTLPSLSRRNRALWSKLLP